MDDTKKLLDEFQTHQLNDSLEFSKAENRDKEMAEEIAEVKEILARMEAKLDPIVEAYSGILFGRKLIVGIASVVVALASIGGAVMYLTSHIKKP